MTRRGQEFKTGQSEFTMQDGIYTVMIITTVLCIPLLVASMPLYKTEFVVGTPDSSTSTIIEKTLDFINEVSQTIYSAENVTVTAL